MHPQYPPKNEEDRSSSSQKKDTTACAKVLLDRENDDDNDDDDDADTNTQADHSIKGQSGVLTSVLWDALNRAVCHSYELWELSCDPTEGVVRQDVTSLQTIKRIPKSLVSELQNTYVPSTRSVVRSSSQRILHTTTTPRRRTQQQTRSEPRTTNIKADEVAPDETNEEHHPTNRTFLDSIAKLQQRNTDVGSTPRKKLNADESTTETDTDTVTLSVSSSSASASLSSCDTVDANFDANFDANLDDDCEDEFEEDFLDATSIPTRTPEEQNSPTNLVVTTTSTQTLLPYSTSNITFERNTMLQTRLRNLDPERKDIPADDFCNSIIVPGHTYTYADDIVHSTPNYHQHQQQIGYRVVSEMTARRSTDKNETDVDRTTGIDTTSTSSRFCCCDATSILETVFRTLRNTFTTDRGNGVFHDGREHASSEKASSVSGEPGRTMTPAVTATTVPSATRRPTASMTLVDPSYDILETAFRKLRNTTPEKGRGNGVLDDGTVHAVSETTPSVGSAPGRTITTPAVTATTIPPATRRPTTARVTTLDPRSETNEDQDVEVRKNMESSKDKQRTSFQNSSNIVVTADQVVELRNTTNFSEATTIKNPTRVIRQQQREIVVPLLVRKQKKPYHSNVYKELKTRFFNSDEKTNNTTTISMGPQRETTKSRTTIRKEGHFLSVMRPKWRRRRHNFVTEPRSFAPPFQIHRQDT